jgi:hypothetical protein
MGLVMLNRGDSQRSQHMYVSGQLVFPDLVSLGNCVTPRAKKDAMNERGSLVYVSCLRIMKALRSDTYENDGHYCEHHQSLEIFQ